MDFTNYFGNTSQKKTQKFPLKLAFLGAILLSLVLRYSLVPYGNFNNNGDMAVFEEWAEKYQELGSKNFYVFGGWELSKPTYPPLSSLMYGEIGYLFGQKSVLSTIHNKIKIPTSSFIVDFNAYGENLLLKIPVILADLGLGVLIYKIVQELTRNKKKAVIAAAFYLLNPVSLFLAGVWGQTESVIAFFAMLSFWMLYKKKMYLSIPLMFVSFYIKPTWVVVLPLYLFLLWKMKPKMKPVVIGLILSLGIFYFTTHPFSNGNLIEFTKNIVVNNMLPGAKGTAKASISAFNFWTIFMRIDRNFDTDRFLLIPANLWGYLFYILINIFAFKYIRREKNKLLGMMAGIFIVGMGSFLLLTNMLERYFFAAFAPLIILIFAKPKLATYLIIMNIVLFLNLVWAFYRRTSDEVDHFFTNNGFFAIKIFSLVNVLSYIRIRMRVK